MEKAGGDKEHRRSHASSALQSQMASQAFGDEHYPRTQRRVLNIPGNSYMTTVASSICQGSRDGFLSFFWGQIFFLSYTVKKDVFSQPIFWNAENFLFFLRPMKCFLTT